MDLNRPGYQIDLFLPTSIVLGHQVSCNDQSCSTPPKREVKGARRVRNACLQCRERKIRCSRTYPCKGCISRGDGPACDWQGGFPSGNISAFQQRATEQRREINGLNARLLSLKKILSSAFPQPYTPSSSQALRSLSKEQRLKKELAYDYYGKHQPVGSLSNATPQTPTAQNSSRKASVCDNLPPNSAASYCTRFSIASGSPVSTQNSTGESISRISPFTSRSFNRSFKPISNQSCSLSSFNEKKYRYRSWKLIKEESVKTVEIENYSNILTSPSTNYIACLNEESFKKMGKPYTRRLTEVHYFPENAQDFVSEGFPEFNPINSYETLKNFPESFSSSSHKPTTLMHRSLDYQASVSDSNRTFNEQRKFRLPSQANYSQDYVLSEYEPLISPEQYQGAFTLPSSGCSLKDKSGFISSQSGASSNLDSEGTHVIQYCESAFAEHNPRVLGPNNYSLNWSTDGNRDFGINLFNADRDGVNKASNCVTTTGYEIVSQIGQTFNDLQKNWNVFTAP